MKHILFLVACLCATVVAHTQAVPYRVVFDLTSADTAMHRTVTRWINEIGKSNPAAQFEVVLYGKSLDMVTIGKSNVADKVVDLATRPNVAFKVCEGAMRNNKVEKSQLLAGVGTVPDGLYQLIVRQAEGWGYIKATR